MRARIPPAFWYRRDVGIAAAVLYPLSLIYAAAILLRRHAYKRGWLRSWRLPVPVIVVGNITVGGTGKTPLVAWLCAFLGAHGHRVGVISRGYGGRSGSKPRSVDIHSDPDHCGDEPLLLARRCRCPVVVHPRRAQAAWALLKTTDIDIIVADDGLQHYALARDVEIAVIDGQQRFGNGLLLPAGPLREPSSRLQSLDVLVCNGGEARGREFAMVVEGAEAVSVNEPHRRRPLKDFRALRVHAVAGIGHPERFFWHLQRAGLEPVTHVFPDHHRLLPEDLSFAGDDVVLMTEKDAVKCEQWADRNHWYVPVTARLPEAMGSAILSLVSRRWPETMDEPGWNP